MNYDATEADHLCVQVLSLYEGAAALALLRLTASAVRLPWHAGPQLPRNEGASGHGAGSSTAGPALPQQWETVQSAQRIATELLSSGKRCVALPPPTELQTQFALRLVRMQTLHAAARQLAAAADSLAAAEAQPAWRQMQQRSEALLNQTLALVRVLMEYTFARPCEDQQEQEQQSHALEQRRRQQQQKRRQQQQQAEQRQRQQEPLGRHLQDIVSSALAESRVLEHAARLLLTLAGSLEDGERVDALTQAMRQFLTIYGLAQRSEEEWDVNGPVARRLACMQAAPCAYFLALAHSMGALVRADGGPSYGLPDAYLRRSFPVLMGEQRAGPSGRYAPERLDTAGVPAMIDAVKWGHRTGRLGRRAIQALALRWARVAVATGRHARDDDGGSRVGRVLPGAGGAAAAVVPQPEASVLLDPGAITFVALWGLQSSGGAMLVLAPPSPNQDDPAAAAAAAAAVAAWVEEVADWWRLAFEVAWYCMGAASGHEDYELGNMLAAALAGASDEPAISPRPASPPSPELQAALAGGLLPGLERLIRRATFSVGRVRRLSSSFAPAEYFIFLGLVEFGLTADGTPSLKWLWPLLGSLLAHGEPQQAAALVVTASKTLRWGVARAAAKVDLGTAEAAQLWLTSTFLQMAIVERLGLEVCAVEDGAGRQEEQRQQQQEQEQPPPPEQSSPAALQLRRMVSYALCEWLPLLARLVRGFTVPRDTSWHTSGLLDCVRGAFLRWLPLLSHACAEDTGSCSGDTSGDSGAGGSASNGSSRSSLGSTDANSDSGAVSWRRFLIEDVGALEVLALMLREACDCATSNEAETGTRAGDNRHVEMPTEMLVDIVTACCAVAAACPSEVLRPSMPVEAASASGAGPAPARDWSEPCWQPAALRSLAWELRLRGEGSGADVAGELASWLEVEAAAADAVGGNCVPAQPPWREEVLQHALVQLSRLLVSPGELRRLPPLPVCANPGCVQLEGDSEVGVKLRACARCGAVSYCCKECQTAHWRAGHKVECAAGRAGVERAG